MIQFIVTVDTAGHLITVRCGRCGEQPPRHTWDDLATAIAVHAANRHGGE